MSEASSPVQKTHGIADVPRFFWTRIRSRFGLVFAVLFFGAIGEVLRSVIAPIWLKKFVDTVTNVATLSDPVQTSLLVLLTAAGIRVLGTLFNHIKFLCNTKLQPAVMHEMLGDAMEKTLRLSHRFFADNFSGALIRKITRIAGNFESLMDIAMTDIWGILLSIGGILIVVTPRFPLIALLIVGWMILTVLVKTLWIRHRTPYFAEYSRLDSLAGGMMTEAFTNVSTVQSFARTSSEVSNFIRADKKATVQMVQNWIAHAHVDLINFALNLVLEVAAMGSMISLLVAGDATVGDLVLVQSFLAIAFTKLEYIGRLLRRGSEAATQIAEALDVMDRVPEIQDVPNAKKLRVTKGEIVFSDASFGYLDEAMIRTLNLTIASKERIGLVGPSGAGKSTLTKLLLRFYDVQSGVIRIDGQNISEVSQESLRKSIAYVSQEPVLFHRSLYENIAYGKPGASLKDVIAAAKKAHCHEFITALPEGYESTVGERGVKLSGGERQRVAIARAILKDAPILMLDEATSSLDSESEALIQDALSSLMRDKTVIVIAHRLSTIMQMDRIIVIEQGRITDTGTHNELLKKVGMYQKLWGIQAGSFQTT